MDFLVGRLGVLDVVLEAKLFRHLGDLFMVFRSLPHLQGGLIERLYRCGAAVIGPDRWHACDLIRWTSPSASGDPSLKASIISATT